MLSERQLKMRRTGIGGSDVAGVLGESPWVTPMDVWADKVAGITRAPTPAMQMGSYVEDGVAQWYAAEMGVKLRRTNCTRRHGSKAKRWMLFTPDRLHMEVPRRKPVLLEIKLVGPKTQDHWNQADPVGVPGYYALQCQWGLEVMDLDEVRVAALFLGSRELKIFAMERNQRLIDLTVDIAGDFWHRHVKTHTPPMFDDSEGARAYLHALYPRNERDMQPAPAEAEALAREYVAASVAVKDAEARKTTAKHGLCSLIGNADGVTAGWGRATWKLDRTGRVDWKGLATSLEPTPEQIEAFRSPPDRKFGCKVIGAETDE